jgi:TPR repeat protein
MPIRKFVRRALLGTCLLAAGGALAPALAFDGTHSPSDVQPASRVDVVPRSAMSVAPALDAVALPRPDAPKRFQSPVEAFRSGAQALRDGDASGGIRMLEYAAEAGHPIAQWKLGRMYADGDQVKRNDLRAFKYFREIADAHAEDNPGTPQARFVANAFVAVGNYYLAGIPNSVVKPDADRAREMFAYAASYFGDPDAQYQLGRMYLAGKGGVKDARQAARWLKLAADKGQTQAQALLGAMLFKGEDVPRQAARGLMYLTMARDAATGSHDKWIAELHAAASAKATDDERALALVYLERWLKGRHD